MLTFVKGRSGRGKTHFVLQEIQKLVASQYTGKIFLIVPDQMSFQTEYQLLNMLPKHTMMQVEVVGLSRLISRLIEELHPVAYTPFETMAQKVLFQHAALAVESSLVLFKDNIEKASFIDYLQQFYRQMRGSEVEIDTILEKLAPTQHEHLKMKMSELAVIYAMYEASLTDDRLDTSNRMELLQKLLEEPLLQKKLGDMQLFIDGYHMFNTQEFETLSKILPHVANGVITFTLGNNKAKDSSIFATVQRQFDLFSHAFPEAIIKNVAKSQRFSHPVLDKIEEHYEHPLPLEHTDESITVDIYADKQAEVKSVASQIRALLMQGISAKEIAVYVANKEQYKDMLSQVFTQYEIPFYMDLKDPMLYHPIMQWLRIQCQIYLNDWQFEDVLALSQNEFFRNKYAITHEMYYIFLS